MKTINRNGYTVAIVDQNIIINDVDDALDIMADAQYHGRANKIVVYKDSLNEAFFDLKTRFAGELLQKFSNYNVKLAIVGNFDCYTSKALNDFIYECNKGDHIHWVDNLDNAIDKLTTHKNIL